MSKRSAKRARVEPSPAPVNVHEEDIRGVLIQLAGARLLLPNATVAEVMSFAPPETVPGAPAWLLGLTRWRGWQVPLIGFAQLAGVAEEQGELNSKVLVLKALGGNPKAPYFAILSQGFPRLVTVSRAALAAVDDGAALPPMVLSAIRLNDNDAYVPDLVAVETLIAETLSAAA